MHCLPGSPLRSLAGDRISGAAATGYFAVVRLCPVRAIAPPKVSRPSEHVDDRHRICTSGTRGIRKMHCTSPSWDVPLRATSFSAAERNMFRKRADDSSSFLFFPVRWPSGFPRFRSCPRWSCWVRFADPSKRYGRRVRYPRQLRSFHVTWERIRICPAWPCPRARNTRVCSYYFSLL